MGDKQPRVPSEPIPFDDALRRLLSAKPPKKDKPAPKSKKKEPPK